MAFIVRVVYSTTRGRAEMRVLAQTPLAGAHEVTGRLLERGVEELGPVSIYAEPTQQVGGNG